jgi:hypothetical protein
MTRNVPFVGRVQKVLLLSMHPQYNISRTPYTPNHTLAIPLQQPNTTPDLINNTNKPKPSPSNTSPSLPPYILLKKQGTAAGSLANYTDFLCNFALYKIKNGTRTIKPYHQTFSNIMQLLLDGSYNFSIHCHHFLIHLLLSSPQILHQSSQTLPHWHWHLLLTTHLHHIACSPHQ